MGMDVFGLNPKIKPHSAKPEEPDWELSSREQRKSYFDADDKYKSENPGIYFRANIWAWRPIHHIIIIANDTHNLGIDEEIIIRMSLNDGAGLDKQEDCDALADAMEYILERGPDIIKWDSQSNDSEFKHAYCTDRTHALQFVSFLRECGGFQVL